MTPSALQIASRVAAAILGGYVFTWGFVALGIVLLLAAGMDYGDARTLTYLLAFLVFLFVFCWSFVAARLTRVWLLVAGGGAAMLGIAWLISHHSR